LPAAELEAFRGELERIDRASPVLLMRHSDLFFALRAHIDLTRSRLRIILAGVQDQPIADTLGGLS
jgi:hypothetical protein